MSVSSIAKLTKYFNCYNAIPSATLCCKRLTAPNFDALAQQFQQELNGRQSSDGGCEHDVMISSDKIIERREWMNAPVVYCDGSFEWTLKKGGIGIFWSPKDERNVHLSLTGSKITNIRAEIKAVSLAALQACSLKFERVIIKTDSQFVVKVINSWLSRWRLNDWKKADGRQIENVDDIQKLSRYTDMIKMRVEHTYGHQKYDATKGCEQIWDDMSCDVKDRCGNFYSDQLSKLAIEEPMMTDELFEQLCESRLAKRSH
ncbi:unnamed protein product [Thelazia callipaeda]|uniref:ribonuclease H n=1 Tax=Thelazia callipaeda TaxID=103827 RepID=A0A0N5CYM2_THECL|nr:unnamed protein product [Thelazia callipaeda]